MKEGDLARRFPSLADIEAGARRRLPRFAYDYVAGGAGEERCIARNHAAFDEVCLRPLAVLDAAAPVETAVELFGQRYAAPFGIAPVGLGGLVWPEASEALAAAARDAGVPYVASTVGGASLERIAQIAGPFAWFQLYHANDEEIQADLLRRAHAAGYDVLVVTVDVPAAGRRPRDSRNGLAVPPRLRFSTLVEAALRPAWTLATLRCGKPGFPNLEPYPRAGDRSADLATFIGRQFTRRTTWRTIERLRSDWPGRLVIKGVLDPAEARRCLDMGTDGLWLSNHGGRQMDAAPSPLESLRALAASGEQRPLLIDSGVRSGLDVARCLALGARMAFAGRAPYLAVAAAGPAGGRYLLDLFHKDLVQTMAQLGVSDCAALRHHLWPTRNDRPHEPAPS